jgi:hypothetical protein
MEDGRIVEMNADEFKPEMLAPAPQPQK